MASTQVKSPGQHRRMGVAKFEEVSALVRPAKSQLERRMQPNKLLVRRVTVTTDDAARHLARLEAPDIKLKRFRASDDLMKFLQSL